MNKIILVDMLKDIGINERYYSLNGDLIPDSLVLYHNYDKWEVFYFSERGEKENIRIFSLEEDACRYIYETLLDIHNTINKYNLNE